jgi:hypothetical protein
MAERRTAEDWTWLRRQPPLKELQTRFPSEWETVRTDLEDVLAKGDLAAITYYVGSVASPPRTAAGRTAGAQRHDALVSAEARRQMVSSALKQLSLSAATGVTEGKVRFNLVNGFVTQRLLFARALERKPVSIGWFRLIWPLVWQKRFLMPLVQPKGIYCFYSKQLVDALAGLIDGRSCLEIAAGDGTLSRFLQDAGVNVAATDDHSWTHSVRFPASVERVDARQALRAHRPETVICSWPPAGNPFEQWVFRTSSVQTYIVIASRHEFASGNWRSYRSQRTFKFAEDPSLSRLILPPEIQAAVYVFRRAEACRTV